VCDRQGVPRLDEDVRIATTLTDDQLAGLIDWGQEAGFPPTVYQLSPGRYALRLYASLTPAQRQTLWQDGALAAARMTPAQRALLRAYARAPNPNEYLWTRAPPGTVDGLALKLGDPQILRRERHGGITTPYTEDDHPLPKASPVPLASPAPRPQKDLPEESVTRFRIRPLMLWAISGSEKRALVSLDVPAEP
jgi:hypothetical protein